jgi:putative ABC transport system permease protein
MSEITDISLLSLVLGYSVLLIPLAGLWYFRTGLLKDSLIGIFRMTLQLVFVALYLEFVFDLNDAWLNSLWLIGMIVVGVFTTIKRSGLNRKFFLLPLFTSGLISIVIIDLFFLGVIVRLDYFFDARYFIPISGMILGNSLNHNIVGMNAYFDGLVKNRDLYQFLLVNRNSQAVALAPFIRDALRKGLNPMIATMSVMGLISLPGMMTGQILGGSSPAIAIKYQIMIMLAIFTGCSLNLMLTILFSNRFAFDSYGSFRDGIMKSNK